MVDNLYLIYINEVGVDYLNNHLYEFIFSDKTEGIDGEDWDLYPASGRPSPPNIIFINTVGRLESKLTLDLVQNSTEFSVWDAVDGVIALGWENISEYEIYPESRMCFTFGEKIDSVKDKLYEKDLTLNFNNKKYEK